MPLAGMMGSGQEVSATAEIKRSDHKIISIRSRESLLVLHVCVCASECFAFPFVFGINVVQAALSNAFLFCIKHNKVFFISGNFKVSDLQMKAPCFTLLTSL